MTKLIQKLFSALLFASPLSLWAANGGAQINYPDLRPVISVAISSDSTATPALNAYAGIRQSYRYCLQAQIAESEYLQSLSISMVGQEVDVYVGIISPSQEVRTWTPVGIPSDPRAGIMNNGIVPYAQKYIPQKGFVISEVKLERICYTFTNDDPLGHYSWFVWLVKSGKPLNNPQNWIGMATAPFFLL